MTGAALTEEEQPELYSRLMEIQASITSDLDKKLYKHYEKIDKIDVDIAEVNTAAANTLSLEKHKNADENAAFGGT